MYEYLITIKIGDVDEEFYFDSDNSKITKQNVIDGMQVSKRKKPELVKNENDAGVEALRRIFGI
jgi:hypothetical protein